MAKKHKGKCPFCNDEVTPTIIDGNTLRRDKCQCSNDGCKGIIYVCRSPGCHNYAKGGDLYDDELCPDCTNSLTSHGGDIVKGAAILVVATAVAAAGKKE